MRSGEELLLLEQVQVTPNRRLGDLEPARQIQDGDRPVLVELLQDLTESILLAHVAHITRIGMFISSIWMIDISEPWRVASSGPPAAFGGWGTS